MSEGRADPELVAENERLRTEIGLLQRALQQTERVAATSETVAERSKRAMLRTHEVLQQRVAELDAAKAAAEAAARAKGRFLATMSHELRTPLNGMLGSTDLLMTTRLDAEQLTLVDLLHRSAQSLLTIVNDILDYSRVESGRVQVESIPFRLRDCIADVVELQRQVAAEKGLQVALTIDPTLPSEVRGDPCRLRQVLMNLVGNAVKFTHRGAIAVSARPTAAGDLIEFEVRDSGVGIAAEALPRLFEAFAQADASTTRRFGGTGLGLVISKRLVELMGGDIVVTSELEVGTAFAFTCRLPAVADGTAAGPVATAAAVAAAADRGRVLVVDDNPGNRLVVRKMLERLGCTSTEAGDGAAAVTAVRLQDFDLVLMDCSMPVMDGYEATRAIRALAPERPHVPVVALTALAMPEDEGRCLQAGMDGYLAKPLRLPQLAAIVDRFLPERTPTR